MSRILALALAAASLTAVPALAQTASETGTPPEEMTMLTQKVEQALRDCDLDETMVDQLTMAQVAGITIAASSADESQKCNKISAIAND